MWLRHFENQGIGDQPPKPVKPPKTLAEEMAETEAMDWSESGYEVEYGMKIKKAEMKKLVIDLQAEDRGKPHWMSSVDWSKVQSVAEKFDESKHRRDAQGQFAPFYHGTSNEIAEKILEEGLKPLSDIDPSSGVVAGKGFAATSEKVAISYAAMASDDSVDTITVIVFKPEASQYFKPAGKRSFGSPRIVAPCTGHGDVQHRDGAAGDDSGGSPVSLVRCAGGHWPPSREAVCGLGNPAGGTGPGERREESRPGIRGDFDK